MLAGDEKCSQHERIKGCSSMDAELCIHRTSLQQAVPAHHLCSTKVIRCICWKEGIWELDVKTGMTWHSSFSLSKLWPNIKFFYGIIWKPVPEWKHFYLLHISAQVIDVFLAEKGSTSILTWQEKTSRSPIYYYTPIISYDLVFICAS